MPLRTVASYVKKIYMCVKKYTCVLKWHLKKIFFSPVKIYYFLPLGFFNVQFSFPDAPSENGDHVREI